MQMGAPSLAMGIHGLARGGPEVDQQSRLHVRLHAEHFEKLGQQESRNPEASSFCTMLRRLRQHTTRIHSPKHHCVLPSTTAEAPCRKTLSFPAAEASLEDGHAPFRQQPLASGRGLRGREMPKGPAREGNRTIRCCDRQVFRSFQNHDHAASRHVRKRNPKTRSAHCRIWSFRTLGPC